MGRDVDTPQGEVVGVGTRPVHGARTRRAEPMTNVSAWWWTDPESGPPWWTDEDREIARKEAARDAAEAERERRDLEERGADRIDHLETLARVMGADPGGRSPSEILAAAADHADRGDRRDERA